MPGSKYGAGYKPKLSGKQKKQNKPVLTKKMGK